MISRITIILLFLRSSAIIHTIPPSTIPTTSTITPEISEAPIEPLVDRIEAIDVSSSQVIILTSKVGPVENAKVSVEVIDLTSGEKLPPLNLAGILLTMTRGLFLAQFKNGYFNTKFDPLIANLSFSSNSPLTVKF